MRTVFEVTDEVFDRVQVGKVYRFDGRKGRVVAKNEPSNRDSRGRVTGRRTVAVHQFR